MEVRESGGTTLIYMLFMMMMVMFVWQSTSYSYIVFNLSI
jgi:hypothetical protein